MNVVVDGRTVHRNIWSLICL